MGGWELGLPWYNGLSNCMEARSKHTARDQGEVASLLCDSRFCSIRLPEEPGLLRSDPPKSTRSSLRRRILVVDDHEDSVTMMAVLFRSKGYDVATARTGIAALEIATTFCPEIVVLDIGLPEIDGYEVARRLRKISATTDTFIIALSGYGTQEDDQGP